MNDRPRPGPAPQLLTLRGAFTLESGDVLPALTIAFHTWGRISPDGDNAVVVCHALTGHSDVTQWWPSLIGPGRALDPEHDFVVCANVLGGCSGTTGPGSPGPGGRLWARRFPRLTVRDMVRAQQRLLDALGVTRVRLALGGSLGGMQALEWALLDARVEAAAVIAAPARHDAWAIAWSDAQRRVLAAVPADDEFGARAGLAAARAIAMLSYRHPHALARRFGREAGEHREFAIQDWLGMHGDKLAARFDRDSYLALLGAMDAHDVGHARGGAERALRALEKPVLVVPIESDLLYPPAEVEPLAEWLPRGELARLDSPHGHDSFLVDQREVGALVAAFRRRLDAPLRAAGGGAS
ncbi:MAG: homoserine O-acetyltransferase [Candidatus Eisenbacteria bacterium]